MRRKHVNTRLKLASSANLLQISPVRLMLKTCQESAGKIFVVAQQFAVPAARYFVTTKLPVTASHPPPCHLQKSFTDRRRWLPGTRKENGFDGSCPTDKKDRLNSNRVG